MTVRLRAGDPTDYLFSDHIVDAGHPEVAGLAARLRESHSGEVEFARAAFRWVRDEIAHAVDAGAQPAGVSASEVLHQRVGLCFAKSHLLAALLRAEHIPAGLCYQRLPTSGGGFVLHGLIAVFLDGGWHRQDPRGNRPGIDAQFSLTEESLAWPGIDRTGGHDYPVIYGTAPDTVVEGLRRFAADGISGLPRCLPGDEHRR